MMSLVMRVAKMTTIILCYSLNAAIFYGSQIFNISLLIIKFCGHKSSFQHFTNNLWLHCQWHIVLRNV